MEISYCAKMILSLIVGVLILVGCQNRYTQGDIIGVWKSTDGAVITFYSDSFRAYNIPKDVLRPRSLSTLEKLSGKGNWSIVNNVITLEFGKEKWCEGGFATRLGVSGRRDAMYLYLVVGDPDNMNYYEFKRVDNRKR